MNFHFFRTQPKKTVPPGFLANQRVLVLIDAQNLSLSVAAEGFNVDFGALASIIQKAIRYPSVHACTNSPTPAYTRAFFERANITPHVNPGIANADTLLAVTLASLVNQNKPDTVLIGSGDADFVEFAQAHVRIHSPGTHLGVIGVWHSVSQRIKRSDTLSRTYLGQDVLVPAACA